MKQFYLQKNKYKWLVCLGLVLFALNFLALAQKFDRNQSPLPAPTGMVNDFANIIDDVTQQQIEQKLRDFQKTSNPSTEIAVATIETTDEIPIFEYSLAVARGWKIGSKETNNPSALLLIAVKDRKYFTQISKDLEGDLPDGIAGSLQRQYLIPAFKQGNYGKGINDLMDVYIKRINEQRINPDAKQTPPTAPTEQVASSSTIICCCIIIIILIIFLILISSIGKGGGGSGSSRDRWRSGGFGGNTSSGSGPIIIWGGGGGSSDWGGSSGGGGDSWGGFGGGGDFGGGGAGGDW